VSLLVNKYHILGINAQSEALRAQSEATLNSARAAAIPGESAATIAATRAGAYKTGQEGNQVAPLARSEIGLRGAQAGYSGALAKQTNALYDPGNLDFDTLAHHAKTILGYPEEAPGTSAPTLQMQDQQQDQQQDAISPNTPAPAIHINGTTPVTQSAFDPFAANSPAFAPGSFNRRLGPDEPAGVSPYAKGTPKVPGKGSGKVDTVPAMLAPGEAVLNKAAAEHMGRGMIEQLNKFGLAKMGESPDAKSSSAKPAKGKPGLAKGGMLSYADGTSDVQPKTGEGDTVKQRNAALKADPRGPNNDTIAVHEPSMLHGMQMMAAAMGMLPARKGFSKGTSKVTKGRGGKAAPAPAQMAPPGGGGPLGLSPDMTAIPPGGALSPDQINPLLMALSQQPQGAAA
jgi:hypothetical protein